MKKLLARYNRLENQNSHNEAAMLLVKNFGTQEEIDIIEGIRVRTNKNGFVASEDYRLRFETSNKYYKFLHMVEIVETKV